MEQAKIPLLSVVIPVHNAENYIEQCIASVLKENVRSMEIICVDDGSTDESAACISAMAAHDGRISLIKQDHQSAGSARNLGLRSARGEFVHFLDSDDWLCPGIYERGIRLLQETRTDVCVFQYISYNDLTGQTRKRPCLCNRNKTYGSFREDPAFFIYNMVAPWNKIYRRAWLEKNNLRFDEIPCGNDRGFYFRMLAAGGAFVLSADYGVYYREMNVASLTGANRCQHFDSLFFAWDSSVKAMEGENAYIQAMLLDCIIQDILNVFRLAPFEKRKETQRQLQRRFLQTDFSRIRALPVPCTWHRDVEKLRAGTHSCEFRARPEAILIQMIKNCRIWGIRGCIVKAVVR